MVVASVHHRDSALMSARFYSVHPTPKTHYYRRINTHSAHWFWQFRSKLIFRVIKCLPTPWAMTSSGKSAELKVFFVSFLSLFKRRNFFIVRCFFLFRFIFVCVYFCCSVVVGAHHSSSGHRWQCLAQCRKWTNIKWLMSWQIANRSSALFIRMTHFVFHPICSHRSRCGTSSLLLLLIFFSAICYFKNNSYPELLMWEPCSQSQFYVSSLILTK